MAKAPGGVPDYTSFLRDAAREAQEAVNEAQKIIDSLKDNMGGQPLPFPVEVVGVPHDTGFHA
jgi:hypothetical protein